VRAAGRWTELKRHGNDLSQGQLAVMAVIDFFCHNNGCHYGFARVSGQSLRGDPKHRQKGFPEFAGMRL
jgi:hypothetical protein